MIKFLLLIIFLILSYLSVIAVSKYDTTLMILLFDYKIEVSLFLVIILFIFILCLSTIGFRIIGYILKVPYLITSKLAGYKKSSQIKLLLDSYAYMIMGKNDITQKTISKINPQNSYKEFIDHINLLKALSNSDSDRNIYLMHGLLSNRQFHDFAAKTIAKRMYSQGFYEQALNFLERANIDISNDNEALYLLILLYAKLNIWDNFVIYMDKYNSNFGNKAGEEIRTNTALYDQDKNEISELYLKGAKHHLAQGEEEEAIRFLEKTLEYDPVNMEAIEIFCMLNISQGLNYQNIAILEAAFALEPSFEIFELYYQSSTANPVDIYENFYKLVDVKGYKGVFLSIAAYLKLFDKIEALLSCKI